MPMSIILAIRCDKPGCKHTIQYHSTHAGINATLIRRIAAEEFGWQATTKGARCFDHRTRVVGFHDFEETNNGWGPFCVHCNNFTNHPKHNREKVEQNAQRLRSEEFVEFRYAD